MRGEPAFANLFRYGRRPKSFKDIAGSTLKQRTTTLKVLTRAPGYGNVRFHVECPSGHKFTAMSAYLRKGTVSCPDCKKAEVA